MLIDKLVEVWEDSVKATHTFLSNDDAEEKIIKELERTYPGIDYKSIFRNYAVSQIDNIRLIEPWQWK